MPDSAQNHEPAAAPAPGTHPTFESAMERLETLVGQMENERLPLEDMIRAYEEGVQLVKVCQDKLTVAEQRIEIITRDAAGQSRVAEYTAPAPSAASALPSAAEATAPVVAPKNSPREPRATPAAPRPAKNPNEVSLF